MAMPSRSRLAAIVVAALLAAACGGRPATGGSPAASAASAGPTAIATSGVLPVVISAELVTGPNRVLFSFLDATGNRPVGAPDRTAKVRFVGPGGERVTAPDGEFLWAIEDVSGIYVTHADFPVAGPWTAEFTTAAPGSPEETVPFGFEVKADAGVVVPGEPAPSVDTPTLAGVGGDVARISTDAEPLPALYETSVADALAAGRPFVLVFATPKFCRTATCGPTLERIKPLVAAHPDVTFINVEPYELAWTDGQLQPVLGPDGGLQSVPATEAFGLRSEPFVFVVGGDGVVRASFEVVFTPQEIEAALAGLR